MQSIGRGAKIEGDQVDFTWTLDNGAENYYKPFTNQQQLENYLRAEGISSFTIVWDDDDTFEVLSDSLMREQELRDAGEALSNTDTRESDMSITKTLRETIADHCSTMSNEQVADCITEIDQRLDAITDKASDDAGTLRTVRAALLTVLETRYPWLDEILDAWVNDDDDDREYAQVVFDALNAEMVLS